MRRLATHECLIEKRHADAGIPDKTRGYVLLPDTEGVSAPYVASPHLANPEQVKDFEKRIIEDNPDGNV